MTLPHRLPGPEVGREIAPGDPAPVTVDDPLDHLPMIPPRPPRPGALSGEQGLDRLPLGVGQHASSAHPPTITFRTPTTLGDTPRSEEHTSELQSRGHLVCRLLLEKK